MDFFAEAEQSDGDMKNITSHSLLCKVWLCVCMCRVESLVEPVLYLQEKLK